MTIHPCTLSVKNTAIQNSKFEYRAKRPSQTNPKQIQIFKIKDPVFQSFELLDLGFLSNFGFRASGFHRRHSQ